MFESRFTLNLRNSDLTDISELRRDDGRDGGAAMGQRVQAAAGVSPTSHARPTRACQWLDLSRRNCSSCVRSRSSGWIITLHARAYVPRGRFSELTRSTPRAAKMDRLLSQTWCRASFLWGQVRPGASCVAHLLGASRKLDLTAPPCRLQRRSGDRS